MSLNSLLMAQNKNNFLQKENCLSFLYGDIKKSILDDLLNAEKIDINSLEREEYVVRRYYISEILNHKRIENESKGIFCIIPARTHAPYYLLLFDNEYYELLDFTNFNKVISKVLLFYERLQLPDKHRYIYTLEILNIYNLNFQSLNSY